MRDSKTCPECRSSDLYRSDVSAGGGHAPNYLPGLGSFWKAAKFMVVLCQRCGLTRFFAPPDALAKVSASNRWTRVY